MNRHLVVVLAVALVSSAELGAQYSVFTYQGRLADGGQPADATYDLRMTLMDSLALGNVIAGPLTHCVVVVSGGLCTVSLSFPSNAFDGSARWLEIGVKTNSSTNIYTLLSPRQAITAAPYAIFANNSATASDLTGGGSQLTNVSASSLTGGTVPLARLSGITTAQLDPAAIQQIQSQTNVVAAGF